MPRWQYELEMSMIAALRKLGNEPGVLVSVKRICDERELYLRRTMMDGPEKDSTGAICGPAYNAVQIELCRRAPDLYFSLIRRD